MEVKQVSKHGMKIGSMEVLFREVENDRIDFMGCIIYADAVWVDVYHESEDSGADWWLEVWGRINGEISFIRRFENLPMYKCINARDMAQRIRPDIAKYR